MKNSIIGGVVAACLLASGIASAEDLRVSPGVPPAHPSYSHAYVPFTKYLPEESGGELTATILGPEVVSLGQMKDALQSEVTQVGLLLPLYFPAEFPNMAVGAEVALVGRTPHAMAAALTEYMVTCKPCAEEMKDFGVVYLGSGSTAVYHLLTTKPVRGMDDLKGLRLRSGGAPWSRWAESVGAVPVNLPIGETFEAISQGTIDGTMATLADLLSFRLVELVKHINMLDMGTYHATSNFTMTLPTWAGLTPEQRAAVARAANRANADNTQRWAYELTDMATDAANKAGIEFIAPTPEVASAFDAFAAQDAETVGALSAERFGITNAGEQVKHFLSLVEKWDAIIKETGADPVAIAARVQEEVWDKVDYATYGL